MTGVNLTNRQSMTNLMQSPMIPNKYDGANPSQQHAAMTNNSIDHDG